MRRALLVSLLGVATLAGCASGHSPGAAGAVPWVDRPLPLYHTPDPKLIRYATDAPPCRAGQLRVSQGQGGAATGNESEPLLFTNLGSRTCLLRGYPSVSAEASTGLRQTLRPRHGTFFGPFIPANLRPGRRVILDFGTSTGCEGGTKPVVRYRNLVFTLPAGGEVAAGRVSIWEQCGLDMSAFGLPARYGPRRARPGTPGTLGVSLQLAARVRSGATALSYTVTLRNPTATPVELDPCPGYTESAYSASRPGLVVRRSFALNCNAVHVIPAHGHVVYAMRLALPRALPAGSPAVKFGWSLDTATGPFAGKVLVVAGT
jgi:Domain of unknown function (DUF4232)